MKKSVIAMLVVGFFCTRSYADFFDQMVNSVGRTAERTVTTFVSQKTAELINNMLIEATSEQTKTEDEVSREYEKENGSLPENATVSSYTTTILPGDSVTPGTKVLVKSVIKVIPGKNGLTTNIEESLTIYDSEDWTVALKSMTKQAGQSQDKGGEFYDEFTFALPEGMPQGVYPVQTTLSLNGELAGDNAHQLQLVLYIDDATGDQQVAVLERPVTGKNAIFQ